MLVTFLKSKRSDNKWFKGYVVFVNVLSMGKTAIHITQAFEAVNQTPPCMLVSFPLIITEVPILKMPQLTKAVLVLTTVLAASVQGFFIFRCWRLFRRRWAPITPFVALWICTAISGMAEVS